MTPKAPGTTLLRNLLLAVPTLEGMAMNNLRSRYPKRALIVMGISLAAVGALAVGFLFVLGIFSSSTARPTPAKTIEALTFTPVPASPTQMMTTMPSPQPSPSATAIPHLSTSNLYIEYVVDASGSMTGTLADGSVKLTIAKDLLKEHIAAFRPETNIGLRALGIIPFQDESNSCQDIELIAAPKAGQLETIAAWLTDFKTQGMTPLAAALQQAVGDFVSDPARINSVVVLSDGIETCGGDPCRLVESLKASGINFTVHVIGLNVDGKARDQLSCVAKSGGGQYYDAGSAQDVNGALGSIRATVVKNEIVVPHGINTPTPVSTPSPMPSATSVRIGEILFLSSRDVSAAASARPDMAPHEIYAMSPDGGAQRALTSNLRIQPESIFRFSVSPDGRKVIFTTSRALFVLARPSPNVPETLLTYNMGVMGMAEWSPDGRFVALVLSDQVVVMNPDSSVQRVLATGDAQHWFPSWSPDGRQIAYDDDQRLFVMNVDGSGKRQLVPRYTRGIAWSPDGTRIAFESGSTIDDRLFDNMDIWLINADGCGLRNLTNTPGVYDNRPSWSPDGTSLVFASAKPSGAASQIIRMEVATGRTWQLTNEGDNQAPFWAR